MKTTYSLGNAIEFPEEFTGSALVLHHPEQIPPHIGVLHEGWYYSLSVKGVKTEIPFARFAAELQKRNNSCVLVELNLPFYIQSPLRYFKAYGPLDGSGETTCLFPIRDWLATELGEEEGMQLLAADFVFELIEKLRNELRIGRTYATPAGETELVYATYTYADIVNEIKRKEDLYARG
jgi:hypothetical protein